MTQTAQAHICPACGWRNETAALRCGGCGSVVGAHGWLLGGDETRPLSVPHSADRPNFHDVATRSAIMPVVAPGVGFRRPSPSGARAPRWPSPGQSASHLPAANARRPAPRRGSLALGFARWLFGVALSLVVFALIAAVVWSMAVRPYLHSRVDGAISDALGQAIAPLPVIPAAALRATNPTVTLTDAEINPLLARAIAPGSGLDSLAVAFQPNTIDLTYSAYGQPGQIALGLQTQDGQIIATSIRVRGPLSWVESDDELRATLDQALTEVGAKTPHGFQQVRITSGQLTVTLQSD